MTEEDAKAWLRDSLHVSRETRERLDALRLLVLDEAQRQNLISAATIPNFWARHIVDSAQLLDHPGLPDQAWLDLGTGAGFPGLVIAILRDAPIYLVESRRLRHAFLSHCVRELDLPNVTVHGCSVESLKLPPVDVISARAFAPLDKLLALSHRFSRNGTVWLLPKGKSAKEEVESIRAKWQGVFHVKQSLTDPDAAIVIASQVRPVRGR